MHLVRSSRSKFFVKQLFWKFAEIYYENTVGRALLLVKLQNIQEIDAPVDLQVVTRAENAVINVV